MLVTVEYALNGRVLENKWVRLNRDGTLDPTFQPLAAAEWNIMAVYPDGRLLGRHTLYERRPGSSIEIGRLVRLLPDGTPDPTFTSVAASGIYGVRILADGQMLIWGNFAQVNGAALRGMALLGSDGTVDSRFRSPLPLREGGMTMTIEQASDGRIFIAGTFRGDAPNTVTREGVRLMALDGTLDPVFGVTAGVSGAYRLYTQPDGSILTASSSQLQRIRADGSRDADFRHGLAGTPTGFSARQPDGSIFYSMRPNVGAGDGLWRLRGDGTPDPVWRLPGNRRSDRYNDSYPACHADGTLVTATIFESERGANHLALTRYAPDGALDASFNPRFSRLATPNSFVWHPDGRAWVSGTFYRVNGVETGTARVLLRLRSDGSTDETFRPAVAPGDQVSALRVLADGRVLAFGTFTVDGTTVSAVRFQSDGSRDSSYLSPRLATASGAANTVDETGRFHVLTSTAANSVTRYLPSGAVDTTFRGAQVADPLSLVTALTDGSVLAISTPTRTPARMVKFRPDGSLDTSFTVDAAIVPGEVVAMAGLPDGRVFVAVVEKSGLLTKLFRITSGGIVDYAYHLPTGLESEETTLRVGGVMCDLLRMAGASARHVIRVSIPVVNQPVAPAVWGDGRIVGANARFYRRVSETGPSVDPRPVVEGVFSEPEIARPVGGEFSLSASFSGLLPMRFELRHAGVVVAESTEPVFARRNLRPEDAGAYTITAINDHGTALTEAVRIEIDAAAGALAAIQQHPQSQTVSAGSDVTFTVVASGAPAPKYQWLFNGGYISGERGPSLVVRRVSARDAGSYSVLVENEVPGRFTWRGQVTSNPAVLTVGMPYCGVYFGSFVQGDEAGTPIAFAVEPDGATAFLGDTSRMALVGGRGLVMNNEGALTGLVDAFLPTGGARSHTLQLRVDAQGRVEGSAAGLGSFTAQRVAATGSALSGYFRAPAVGAESSVAHIILAADGRALVVLIQGPFFASGSGMMDREGRLPLVGPVSLRLATDLAEHQVQLMVEGGAASTVFSDRQYFGLRPGAVGRGRISNVSMRGRVSGATGPLIAGFVVAGERLQPVLIRAVGPSLAPLGVSDALAAPQLAIHRGTAKLDEGGAWGVEFNRYRIAAAAARVGAFPLAASGRDAAKLLTLAPGAYTAQVTTENPLGGVALLEVYAVGEDDAIIAPAGLLNVAARAVVEATDGSLIAGFVVEGTAPRRLLLRAVGPTLASFGVDGTLADPAITLLSGSSIVATNDDWNVGLAAVEIRDSAVRVGAFAFPPASRDAALLVTLRPGSYTLQVRGRPGTSGTALVEAYEVTP